MAFQSYKAQQVPLIIQFSSNNWIPLFLCLSHIPSDIIQHGCLMTHRTDYSCNCQHLHHSTTFKYEVVERGLTKITQLTWLEFEPKDTQIFNPMLFQLHHICHKNSLRQFTYIFVTLAFMGLIYSRQFAQDAALAYHLLNHHHRTNIVDTEIIFSTASQHQGFCSAKINICFCRREDNASWQLK